MRCRYFVAILILITCVNDTSAHRGKRESSSLSPAEMQKKKRTIPTQKRHQSLNPGSEIPKAIAHRNGRTPRPTIQCRFDLASISYVAPRYRLSPGRNNGDTRTKRILRKGGLRLLWKFVISAPLLSLAMNDLVVDFCCGTNRQRAHHLSGLFPPHAHIVTDYLEQLLSHRRFVRSAKILNHLVRLADPVGETFKKFIHPRPGNTGMPGALQIKETGMVYSLAKIYSK